MKDFITVDAGAKKSVDVSSAFYDKSEMVAAMPKIKATVEDKETFSARLKAEDGRIFVIGSDKGEQDVWHFVATALKVGQTYELPQAFLDYQKREFYDSVAEIKAMPARKATLELRGPCYSIFRNTDGKQFVIGSPGSGDKVWGFLGTLEEGKTYELPKAFLDDLAKPKRKKAD